MLQLSILTSLTGSRDVPRRQRRSLSAFEASIWLANQLPIIPLRTRRQRFRAADKHASDAQYEQPEREGRHPEYHIQVDSRRHEIASIPAIRLEDFLLSGGAHPLQPHARASN